MHFNDNICVNQRPSGLVVIGPSSSKCTDDVYWKLDSWELECVNNNISTATSRK